MTPEEARERTQADLAILQRHTAQLAEHFDTVQIFVSRDAGPAGTFSMQYGAGNWNARIGQVMRFAKVDALQPPMPFPEPL